MVLALNSCSWKRSEAPAQWVVVPPTVLQIQAGRPGKSLATRQLPEVVRLSSQASWAKLPHSSLTKVVDARRVLAGLEQHHLDALLGQLVGERAAAGARADDDHHAVVVQVVGRCHGSCLPQPRYGGGLASASGCSVQPASWKPRSR